MTKDPELAEALSRVERYFDGVPPARMVRDLAIKGAEAHVRENEERMAALERLAILSTPRADVLDWDFLERVRETAWGE